jgi:hypothetical protein
LDARGQIRTADWKNTNTARVFLLKAMKRLITLGVSVVVLAGCGGGRVDKNSDAYSDGEACGRIYLQTYNEKTMKRTPISKAVALCKYNHNLYKTPGGTGNNASYVAGVKDMYRQAKAAG